MRAVALRQNYFSPYLRQDQEEELDHGRFFSSSVEWFVDAYVVLLLLRNYVVQTERENYSHTIELIYQVICAGMTTWSPSKYLF